MVVESTGIGKEIVSQILTETMLLTRKELKAGSKVYWPGLCTFEWKITAKAKRLKTEPENPEDKGLTAKKFKLEDEEAEE